MADIENIAAEKVIKVAEIAATKLIESSADAAKKLIETAKLEAIAAKEEGRKMIEKAQMEGHGLFLDLNRIPLICEKIVQIHQSLGRIEKSMVNVDQFAATRAEMLSLADNQRWIVRSVIGVIIAAVLGVLFVNK